MDPTGYHVKLIELAYQMASAKATSEADPFGPMMSCMPGMQLPDTSKALGATDSEIGNL